MVVVALLSVYLVESVYVVSVYLVVNCTLGPCFSSCKSVSTIDPLVCLLKYIFRSKQFDMLPTLFQWAYEYKLRAFSNGESTPILDRLVFKNLKALVGGKVRLILTGGAPLSPETHNFIRTCFHVPLVQGCF